MYWNTRIRRQTWCKTRLIETWDVLKSRRRMLLLLMLWINRNMRCIEIITMPSRQIRSQRINRNMRCIEINLFWCFPTIPTMINRNRRCIEIPSVRFLCCSSLRLIETWDVLKCNRLQRYAGKRRWLIETWDVLKWVMLDGVLRSEEKINRNMRCIEICKYILETVKTLQINRNMRCIEIKQKCFKLLPIIWLIETWDVLKWIKRVYRHLAFRGLIETWDVLKFYSVSPFLALLPD